METQWKAFTKDFNKDFARALDQKNPTARTPAEKIEGYIADLSVKTQRIHEFLDSSSNSQARTFSNPLYIRDNALSEIELSTWRLMHTIFAQESNRPKAPFATEQTVAQLRLIIKWIETYFENTSQKAQNAIRIVEESRSRVLKSPAKKMRTNDPDARFRGVQVDDSITESNEKLLNLCWELLKAGRRDMINDICVANGQEWRAASFFGAGSSDTLWRMSCFVLSKKAEISPQERAIYGLFSGNYGAVAPFCKTWEERLWAAAHIYLDSVVRNSGMVVDDCDSFFEMLPDGDDLRREFESARFSSLANIFEIIDTKDSDDGDVIYDVKYVFNRIQECLLLNSENPFNFLVKLPVKRELDRSEVLEFNGFQLPRFIVHYINFFVGLSPEKCAGVAGINGKMLDVLINEFIEKLFIDDLEALAFFVPYYSSFIYAPDEERVRFFADKVLDLFKKISTDSGDDGEERGKERSLKSLEDFKLEIIEKNGHNKFGFDKVKVTQTISKILFEEKNDSVASVKWLSLFVNMRLQGLTQANISIQEIVDSMEYPSGDNAFLLDRSKRIFDAKENTDKIKMLDRVVQSVPEDATYLVNTYVNPESYSFAVDMIYEFECHKLCVEALMKFLSWEDALNGNNFAAANTAAEAFERNVLDALKYENGLYSYPYFIPQLEMQSRIDSLKRKLIPNLFYRLLHVYTRLYSISEDKNETYFVKAKELIRVASLEKYKCYECFEKKQLMGLIKAFNSFKVDFLSSPSYPSQ